MGVAPRRSLAIGVLLFAVFMDLLDVTIVQVALPEVGADFSSETTAIEWVVSGYLLAFAVALVTGGRLGDIYGRKRVFLLGVLGFTLSSALCAGAWSLGVLIGSRVLQGFFAAIMVPQLLASVQALFAPRERAPWYGVIGAITGIAAVAGPLLGGLLIDLDLWGLGWRTIFLINLPIGLVITVLAWLLVPETRSRHPLHLDLVGVGLLSAAILLLLVPIVQGRTFDWAPWLWAPIAAGVAFLIAFLVHCRRRQTRDGSAVLPLALFRNRGFSAGVVVQAMFQGSMNAFTLPFIFYLQMALGLTAFGAGMNLLAFSLGSMIATALVVPLIPRLGKYLVTFGAVAMAVGIFWVITIAGSKGTSFSAGTAIIPMVLAGVGLSAVVIPLVDVALATVPVDDAGAASGALTTFQQLGAALGVASSMTVFFAVVGSDWSPTNAFAALETAIVISLAGLAIAAITSLVLPNAQKDHKQQQNSGPQAFGLETEGMTAKL